MAIAAGLGPDELLGPGSDVQVAAARPRHGRCSHPPATAGAARRPQAQVTELQNKQEAQADAQIETAKAVNDNQVAAAKPTDELSKKLDALNKLFDNTKVGGTLDQFAVFARYDKLDYTYNNLTHVEEKLKDKYYKAGISYDVLKNLKLALVYKHNKLDGPFATRTTTRPTKSGSGAC